MTAEQIDTVRLILDILTPVIGITASVIIIPLLRRRSRFQWQMAAKQDSMIAALSSMNSSAALTEFSNQFKKKFDDEYGKRMKDKNFIDNG